MHGVPLNSGSGRRRHQAGCPISRWVRGLGSAIDNLLVAQEGPGNYGSTGNSKKINGFPVAESLIPSITTRASFQIAVWK